MNRIIYISAILFLFVAPSVAQQRLSVELFQQSVTDLFDMIEQQTGARIFCTPGEADTMKITILATDQEPLQILREALRGTPFHVTGYQNIFFILNNKEMITSLPNNYFISEEIKEEPEPMTIKSLLGDEQRKAISEQKVYDIGNATAPKTGMVTLSGNVTHIKTGEPLTGITLFIADPLIGTTTDGFGYYTIRLPAGRQELNIRGLEVKETKRQLMLYSDGTLNVELEEKIYALGDVVLIGKKENNIKATSIGAEYLKMKDIKNIPTAFGEADILRVVMALPGVKAVGEISSGFNVRGGATDQNLILYNGNTIYNPTHLFGMFSAFNPDVVNDMELYKSSIPVKYGGRISSVLDINSREGNKKEFQGSGSLGLLTSQLNLEGPVFRKKGSIVLSGRTTYSNWLLKKIPEKFEYSNGSANFYDLNGTFVYTFNEQNKLFLSGYTSKDRFTLNGYGEQYGYRNTNASARWRRIVNKQIINVLTVGYDHYDYQIESNEQAYNAYTLAYKISQGFLKSDLSWFPDNNHTVNIGLSHIFYNFSPGEYLPKSSRPPPLSSWFPPEPIESLVAEDRIQQEKALESAIYIGDEWVITPKFSVSAGLRYSMFNVLGPREYNVYMNEYLPSLSTIEETQSVNGICKTYHGPELRLSARYAFSDDLSVKAGVNTMRQYIHKISNTSIMSPTDTWKLSDPNIRPQKGMQIAGGVFKNFPKIEISLELYYKTMKDYLDYRSGAKLEMNHHIETEVLGTKGRSYGIELMLKKPTGKLNGWVSYAYARTMLRQTDKRISRPANNGDWYPADFDKPHEIKFTGNYKFTHRYSLSLNIDYSTGRPITLPVAKYQYAGGQYLYYTHRNQYRIPNYFRIDMSFNIEPSHHLTLVTHSSFSFGVYNLTARKNAYSVYYVAYYGNIEGYKMSIFGTIIPFVSYNIKF